MVLPTHIDDLIYYLDGVDISFYAKSGKLRNTNYYKKLRAGYLRLNPFCVLCETKGMSTFATELDHIVPARKKPLPEFFDVWNFQGLCTDCHTEKSTAEREADAGERFMPDADIRVTEDGEVIPNGA